MKVCEARPDGKLRGERRRRGGLFAVVVVAAVAATSMLSACAAGSGSQGAGSNTSTLTIGLATGLDTIDPAKTGYDIAACQMLCEVYDTLIDADASGKLVPGIATSWSFSSDGLTLTLKIRTGVRFSDGTVLDATGVKANLDHMRLGQGSLQASTLSDITDVVAVNPTTVEIKLKTADSLLPNDLADLAGIQVSPTALKDGMNLGKQADGSGPYEIASYTPGSELVLKRKASYWGTMPTIETLDYKFITDPAALTNALLSGEVDVAQVQPSDLKPFTGNSGFVIKSVASTSTQAMAINWKVAGLNSLEARQAVLYALDRVANCKDLLAGYCQVTDQPYANGYYANDGSGDQVLYPYDPAKARQLLAAAGVKNVKFSAMTGNNQGMLPMAEAVQAQLNAVGIDMSIQQVDSSTLIQDFATDKTLGAVFISISRGFDPGTVLSNFVLPTSYFNPSGVSTPAMQKTFANVLSSTSADSETKLLQAASEESAEQVLLPVLNIPTNVWVLKKGLDFTPSSTMQDFGAASFAS